MARAPRLRPLSVYCLKEGVVAERAAVSDPEALVWHELDEASGVQGAVAVRPPARNTPWWVSYLGPHLRSHDRLGGLANSSTGALLLIRAAGRLFAFSFGLGRHLLDPEAYEQDFGLKVVLNIVEPDSLTSVDARTMDEITVHTRRDVSQGSSFSAFGLDVSRDLVRAVTGPPRDETLGRRAAGSDSLYLLTRAQLADLPRLCERLLAAYTSNDYKERFGWIDHLRRVRSALLIQELDEALLTEIRAGHLTDIHLAPPEPLPWQRLAGFTFTTRNEDELDADPRITGYLATIDAPNVELSDLKHDRVIAQSADTNHPLEAWPIYKCIVYEARKDDNLYALSAGQWYRVSASFAQEVVDYAAQLPQLGLALPAAALGAHERDFNTGAAQAIDGLCLDQRLVVTPAGDRIEFCDLLTRNRQLVHVKKRGSSSTLSHLFSQGLVSAELLSREDDFRQAVKDTVTALDKSFTPLLPTGRPPRDEWEVGFVVITRSQRETPLTLPFFSLVNLSLDPPPGAAGGAWLGR